MTTHLEKLVDDAVATAFPPAPQRRRAIIILDDQLIAKILDLPEELKIVAINADSTRLAILVAVEGDTLDPVPPGAEPPLLSGSWSYDGEAQLLRFVPPSYPGRG